MEIEGEDVSVTMHRKKYPISNQEAISYFATDRAQQHLKDIYSGKVYSRRHYLIYKMFNTGVRDLTIYSEIRQLSFPDYLEEADQIDQTLCKLVEPVYEAVTPPGEPKFDTSESGFRRIYAVNVLIPEGIIRLLEETNNWSHKTAENSYVDRYARVTERESQLFDEEIDEDNEKKRQEQLKSIYNPDPSDEDPSEGEGGELPDLEETGPSLEDAAALVLNDLTEDPVITAEPQKVIYIIFGFLRCDRFLCPEPSILWGHYPVAVTPLTIGSRLTWLYCQFQILLLIRNL